MCLIVINLTNNHANEFDVLYLACYYIHWISQRQILENKTNIKNGCREISIEISYLLIYNIVIRYIEVNK